MNITINGGSGKDTIRNDGGSNVLINGGDGDDYIENSNGSTTIYTGEGNDTINSTYALIKIVEGNIDNAKLDGEDVIIKIGSNTTRLVGVKDKEITLVSAQGETIKFTNSYVGVADNDTSTETATIDVNAMFGGLDSETKQAILSESLNTLKTLKTVGEGTAKVESNGDSSDLKNVVLSSSNDFVRMSSGTISSPASKLMDFTNLKKSSF